jgi:hypothetical protein
MQVSIRTADYLVDVIALRRLVGPVLAPVFADTKVSTSNGFIGCIAIPLMFF